jgi:hypothetical protein
MADHPVGAATAGILLFVIGLGIGGGAIEIDRRGREQFPGWLAAPGTIVAASSASSSPSGRPLIAFTTATGDRVSFTARAGAMPQGRTGDTVPVLYPPDEPTAAIVDPRQRRWMRDALLAGASLILMALGAYVAWYARNRDLRSTTR